MSTSTEDTHQMINGKLSKIGRQPRNVQVSITMPEIGGAECLHLQDETGIFLQSTELKPELDARARESQRSPMRATRKKTSWLHWRASSRT